MVRNALVFGLVAIFAACASEAPRSVDDDDGDDATGTTVATTAGVGGASGGAGGTATTSAGGAASDDSLYPLAVGHAWTYEVSPVGAGAVCAGGMHTASVIGTSMLDGRQAFEVSNWCSGVSGTSFVAAGDGEEVLFNYSGDWLRLIAEPIEAGYSWPYFNTSYTWEAAPNVTVPAGTFNDCWTSRQDVSYTAYATYCPGVGLVQSYSEDLAGSGWNAVLSGTNF